MGNIWFTSDTHYGHSNIASKNCSKWSSGYREFKDLDEMNNRIVKNINTYVKEDDILYHLGDWSFGGIDNIWNFRKQIKCKNIHLILGNHDTHIYNDRELPNVKRVEVYSPILIDGKPIGGDYCDYINAKGLFTSVQDVLTVKHGKTTFFLSHYAHRVWYGSHKGIIHLYGHSHDSLDSNYGKSIDVGVDSAKRILKEYRPFKLEEIMNIMDKREIYYPDKHNINTNI